MIDIEHNIKYQQSKGYEQWAKIHNLKLAAKTINIISERDWSYDDLSKQASAKSEKLTVLQDKIKFNKQRIKELDTIIKALNTYRKLKPIYEEYTNKNPLMKNNFYNKHQQEIDLFQRTAEQLKRYMSKDGKLPNIKTLESERKRLQSDISKQTSLYQTIKEEFKEIEALKKNVDMFLKTSPEIEQVQPKKKPSLLEKLNRKIKPVKENTKGRNEPEL